MTPNNIRQQNSNPELKAQDVYQLVREALQEHFQLDMTNSDYEAQDIFDVLLAACVERISIEMGSNLLEDAPSGTFVRTHIKEMLGDIGQLTEVETNANQLLSSCLPRKLLKSK